MYFIDSSIGLFVKMGKMLKETIWEKRRRKATPQHLQQCFVWFLVGIWHGGNWKYIISSGLLQWFYIVCGKCRNPGWTD